MDAVGLTGMDGLLQGHKNIPAKKKRQQSGIELNVTPGL